jgi:hypothetical protein
LREGGRHDGCHAMGEDVGGLAPPDGQRPGWWLRAGGTLDVGTGVVGWLLGGPPATVPAAKSNGLNRFLNLNNSKMFKFF